jgi:6-aminohexanoate-oligomer exohydrolase
MTALLQFDMDYPNPASEVQTEDRCAGWRPRRPGDPADSRDFLTTLKAAPADGSNYQYCSATTDALSWVLERAAGVPYAQLVAARIWSRIGAERDAYFTIDSAATPYACAGMGMTLRDLARFGRLVLDGGSDAGQQVIPASWIDTTRAGADRGLDLPAEFLAVHPAGGYRNQWWITGDDHGCFTGRGIFGQYLWLDPVADLVIAKFSSQPVFVGLWDEHACAFRAIADAVLAPSGHLGDRAAATPLPG